MRIVLLCLLIITMVIPASALNIEAPSVPESGSDWMPNDTSSFANGVMELLENGLTLLHPKIKEASRSGLSVLTVAIFLSAAKILFEKGKRTLDLVGAVTAGMILLKSSNAMIPMAAQTIRELNDYGKLLFPVMTAAMAAQGGITTSAALYAGTAVLNTLLGSLLANFLVPGVYLFLTAAVAYAATGAGILKRIREGIKTGVSWCLKMLLTVFTTYMSITGVVSGTTDAAVLKTTKVTISSVVPVVGGILSDASEAVLVSAGVMKNAAGIYGILAVLAVFLEPFIKIGTQYILLKLVSVLCLAVGDTAVTSLTEDFSTAMGLLLAMTGSVCLLLMISTVCFMKGVG